MAPVPVLLALRNADLRTTLCLFLEAEGYHVEEAPPGVTALTGLLLSPQPLVVLVDACLDPQHAEAQSVAEDLLALAGGGGPAGRRTYLLCNTLSV